MKKFIHLVTGARPNFPKIAPLYHALAMTDWALPQIVDTGQHYEYAMSSNFYEIFSLPKPSISLKIKSGSHTYQVGKTTMLYGEYMVSKPDLVVVVGDVNTSLGAAIAASKSGVRLVHIEAGLRSFDRSMPEEINRILIDRCSDHHFVHSESAYNNLLNEGIKTLHCVGNIMIDSLKFVEKKFNLVNESKNYIIATLHRPFNVSNPETLMTILCEFEEIAKEIPIKLISHPRTLSSLMKPELATKATSIKNLEIIDPMPYDSFMKLLYECKAVITDSGGLQEESSYLNKPCFTIRPNTERPITLVPHGTNMLCKHDFFARYVLTYMHKEYKKTYITLWDGQTASRIVKILEKSTKGELP